ALEGREAAQAPAREAAQGARAEGEALRALAVQQGAEGSRALARPARGSRARRRRRETPRSPLPSRLTRGCGPGEEVQDRRLRDRRLPLQRESRRQDLDAPARPLRRQGRARLRRALLGDAGGGAEA